LFISGLELRTDKNRELFINFLILMWLFQGCAHAGQPRPALANPPKKTWHSQKKQKNNGSVSSRISKEQGYQGFLSKRAGSSFGKKRAICVVQGKT
jgi:hypothetical protein